MRRVRSFPIVAAGFAVLLVALFAASCGGGEDEPTPMIGTYAITSITCGDGTPGPSWLTDRIIDGRTWKVSSTDGHVAEASFSDGACTASWSLVQTFPTSTSVAYVGTGTFVCSPSADACSDVITALFGSNLCDTANTETGTWSHTPFPEAVGGTTTFTSQAGYIATTCSDSGLTNPLSYVLTREE
jgi:hypothetical protein